MGEYYIYLRKSRADRELEALGQGETLARHEKTLLDYAKRNHLSITRIYKEIVSGETIDSRPEAQKLLKDIYNPGCDGVLVMEIERLARGNTKDQGTIAEAFKYSNTKIVTPAKTYDPNDEFDEEYFEFGLFMSRREYKTINRRIQRGRTASATEGKYIGSTAPYGYEKVKLPHGKGYTLEIKDEDARVVQYIYDLYVNGIPSDTGKERLGQYRIAKKLDELGIKPRSGKIWSVTTIRDILTNPVYTGKIRWGYKKETKQLIDGKIKKERTHSDNFILVDGIHKAIISQELFDQAQLIRKNGNYHVTSSNTLKNPLTGLVKCKLCGSVMTRTRAHRNKEIYSLSCPNRYCKNVSSPIYILESSIIKWMKDWLQEYHTDYDNRKLQTESEHLIVLSDSMQSLEKEIESLKHQITRTYDLLEQGIYSNEIFLERNKTLNAAISEKNSALEHLQQTYQEQIQQTKIFSEFIPEVENLIACYDTLPNAQEKNDMLKKVINHVEYQKDNQAKKNQLESTEFTITVFPKIPS